MNKLEFFFEETPLDRFLGKLKNNDTVSASALLMAMEDALEDKLEDAFARLRELAVRLDLSDLPRPSITGSDGLRLRRERELTPGPGLLEQLEENDPLRVYLEELALIPACGDICLLAEELVRSTPNGEENDNLRVRLINLSLNRVVELAFRYTGWGVFLLDLIQEGSLGLWYATECFRGKGSDFEKFGDRWIEFYMKKAVIQEAWETGTGRRLQKAMEDYCSVDERLLSELGRNPTLEEIAEEAHMTLETAALVSGMLENARMMQRAKAVPEPAEEDPEEQQAVENTAYFQTRQRISDMMAGLTPTQARVIALRFGLEGGLPLSPEETGRKLGLTPGEVVAAEAEALTKMRTK